MGVDEALTKITAALKKPTKPDLARLSAWVHEKLSPLSMDKWEQLQGALCKAYKLNEEELAEVFKPPAITQAGGYIDDFTPLLQEQKIEGWLRDYTEFTRNMEPPTAFHFFSALTVLGASLKRQTWVDQAYYRVWPAVQCILVGPSQRVKKSTAGTYAVSLGEEANRFCRLMDEGTEEALKSELAGLSKKGAAAGLIFSSELAVLLGTKEYNRGLVQALTDLFDSRIGMRRRTQGRGNEEIKNIAVSMLACTNEKWMRSTIPPSAIEGGFMARMLLVYQGGTDRKFPRPKLPDFEQRDLLIDFLKRTQFVNGETLFTKNADKYYDEFYCWMKDNYPTDERLAPFWERYPDHMLRMAMLLSVSEDVSQRKGPTVREHHFIQARALLDWVMSHLPELYAELGMTEYGDQAMEIVNFMWRNKGTATEGELTRKMVRRIGKQRLRELLETLIQGRIIRRKRSRGFDGEWQYYLVVSPKEL